MQTEVHKHWPPAASQRRLKGVPLVQLVDNTQDAVAVVGSNAVAVVVVGHIAVVVVVADVSVPVAVAVVAICWGSCRIQSTRVVWRLQRNPDLVYNIRSTKSPDSGRASLLLSNDRDSKHTLWDQGRISTPMKSALPFPSSQS